MNKYVGDSIFQRGTYSPAGNDGAMYLLVPVLTYHNGSCSAGGDKRRPATPSKRTGRSDILSLSPDNTPIT